VTMVGSLVAVSVGSVIGVVPPLACAGVASWRQVTHATRTKTSDGRVFDRGRVMYRGTT
jgi:hypothetical protein